jgi:hypothetical protein
MRPMKDQPQDGERERPNLTGTARARKDRLRERQAEEMRRNLHRRKRQQREREAREPDR